MRDASTAVWRCSYPLFATSDMPRHKNGMPSRPEFVAFIGHIVSCTTIVVTFFSYNIFGIIPNPIDRLVFGKIYLLSRYNFYFFITAKNTFNGNQSSPQTLNRFLRFLSTLSSSGVSSQPSSWKFFSMRSLLID